MWLFMGNFKITEVPYIPLQCEKIPKVKHWDNTIFDYEISIRRTDQRCKLRDRQGNIPDIDHTDGFLFE